MLRRQGIEVGRRHVATLMRRMGIEAIYRKPNASRMYPMYRYPLRGLAIERANQVWAMDITYIPVARGFVSAPSGALQLRLADGTNPEHIGRVRTRARRSEADQNMGSLPSGGLVGSAVVNPPPADGSAFG